MSRDCRECGGELEIIGTGYHGGIEVECLNCGEFYEVESDGLGEGGEEYQGHGEGQKDHKP